MNDVIGLSDVATPDTGRGGSTKLKTGGMRREYNMKKKPNIVKDNLTKRLEKNNFGKKDKCKKWKELGYSSLAGCRHDNPKSKQKSMKGK